MIVLSNRRHFYIFCLQILKDSLEFFRFVGSPQFYLAHLMHEAYQLHQNREPPHVVDFVVQPVFQRHFQR